VGLSSRTPGLLLRGSSCQCIGKDVWHLMNVSLLYFKPPQGKHKFASKFGLALKAGSQILDPIMKIATNVPTTSQTTPQLSLCALSPWACWHASLYARGHPPETPTGPSGSPGLPWYCYALRQLVSGGRYAKVILHRIAELRRQQ